MWHGGGSCWVSWLHMYVFSETALQSRHRFWIYHGETSSLIKWPNDVWIGRRSNIIWGDDVSAIPLHVKVITEAISSRLCTCRTIPHTSRAIKTTQRNRDQLDHVNWPRVTSFYYNLSTCYRPYIQGSGQCPFHWSVPSLYMWPLGVVNHTQVIVIAMSPVRSPCRPVTWYLYPI